VSNPAGGAAAAGAHPPRRIGDRAVYPIGLGCMPLSAVGRPDRGGAVATIHAALDAGVELLDTADAYAIDQDDIGHGERLIAEALRGRRDDALVATKGGHVRHGTAWGLDGTPTHLRAACEASLRNLDREAIELYQLHRPDPRVPFSESVGALRDLRDEGKIVGVGLSNVTAAQLDEAAAIVPIAAVQNELSLGYPDPLVNGEVDACSAYGIPLLAWSPLGGMAAARLGPRPQQRRAGGRRGAWRLPPACGARMAAGVLRRHRADTGGEPSRDHPRLGGSHRTATLR
jgi:aryl-alcohol dehydrogenase-like predicted oxidoreductase